MRSTGNILFRAAIAASLGLAAGCAGQPRPLAANAEATAAQECGSVTGSRITPEARNECRPLGYPFRSYSSQDLEATGHIDLVEALRSVDPAFR